MPKYDVLMTRTITFTTNTIVRATSEDAAREKALQMASDQNFEVNMWGDPVWDQEDDDVTIEEINPTS